MTFEDIIALDTLWTLSLNGNESVFWDNLMYVATDSYVWTAVALAALYVIVKNNKAKETMLVLACLAIMLIVSNVLCSLIVKPYFMRLRPCQNPELADAIHVVRGYCETSYSFYSSHACNAMSLALFLSCLFRSTRFALTSFAWAITMIVSRVYLGQHYVLDVVVGGVIGLAFGLASYILYDRLAARLNGRCLISEQFTSSGYMLSDIDVMLLVFALNCWGVLIFSLTYGV